MIKNDSNIVKKTIIYFIGNFASKIIMAIMIPFYAYFVTVEELGFFDYSQTIMYILAPVIYFAIWEAILRFILIEDNEQQKRNIIFTSLTLVIGITLLVLVFTLVIFNIITNYLIIVTSIMISCYGLAQIWQYFARGLGHNKVFIKASLIGTLLNFFLLLSLVIIFDLGIYALFWSYILGQFSIIIIIEKELKILKNLKGSSFDFKILKLMLLFSLPLVLNLASNFIISGIGRIVLMQEKGAYESGIYSFALKFGTIISMFGSVISMALIEESIIKNKNQKIDRYFSNIIEIVFRLFLIVCIVAVPFIFIFYKIIPDNGYNQSYSLIPIFLVYALFMTMSTNIGAIFQAKNKTSSLFYTTSIAAVITVFLSVILVKFGGLLGVVVAQLIGSLTLLILRWSFARKLIELKIKWKKILFLAVMYVLIVLSFSSEFNILTVLISLTVFFLVMFINKDLKIIFSKLKKVKK